LGIDVSKDTFDATIANRTEKSLFSVKSSHKFANNPVGFKAFLKWVKQNCLENQTLYVLMEATGVYHEELAMFIHEMPSVRLSILVPTKVKNFAKSLNFKTFTDKIDAAILAQMVMERDLMQWVPPSTTFLKLKRLTRERQELLETKTVISNRLHAKSHSRSPLKESKERGKKQIELLKKLIREIEKEIEALVKADDKIKRIVDNIISTPGIGKITAYALLAETDNFELFTSKGQLVSYSGYDVVNKTSGTSVNTERKISKRGNSHIRRALYFPSISAVKHCSLFREIWEKSFERNRIKMKAYVAVQRKLLVLVYTLVKKNEKFDPNFKSQSQLPQEKKLRQELV
jgi:transposase